MQIVLQSTPKLFNCKRTDCIRASFPMDWESGHYFEIEGEPNCKLESRRLCNVAG